MPKKGYKQSKKHKDKIKQSHLGKNHYNWKNGRIKRDGYWYIWKSEHPFVNSDNYILHSHLIAEECLGRYLTKIEVIHHLGIKYPMDSIENKGDDRPENLYLFTTTGEHTSYHHLEIKPKLVSNLA